MSELLRPRKRAGRPRWLLTRLAAFVAVYGWWPSAPELMTYVGRGSRWTIWRDLRLLARYGLVERVRRAWRVTGGGWQYLGQTALFARFERRQSAAERSRQVVRRRLAAHTIFINAHTRPLPIVD